MIDLPDGTKQVDAYHFPHNSDEKDVYEHFSEIRASNFMQQVQLVQTQKILMPDAWYRVNYIIFHGFPIQLNLAGATWMPHKSTNCEPFEIKRLN